MALVKFYRGLEQFYSVEKFGSDSIYFATDTGVLLLNGVKYGFNPDDESIDILSMAGWEAPDIILFTCTNGKTVSVKLPTASVGEDGTVSGGLMTALDKETFDKIPEVYATKEEMKNQLVGIYHYRGTVETLNDLPTEGLESGDVYRIKQEFVLDGQPYAAGTHVVYTSTGWHAMEGEEPGYSKSEADEKFVAWVEDDNANKLIILPKGSKIIGTMISNDGANLLQLGIYDTETGQIEQVELGSTKIHLTLNSSDRPSLDLPDGKKEDLAYMSDIELIPHVVNFPLRTLQDKVYTQEEILGWFGVESTTELRSIISSGGIQYVKYGIILNTPRYYKMPVDYVAFESDNQIKLVFNGLDTRDDTPCKYEIIMNLDGTIIDGNSNIKLTLTSMDVTAALQWNDVTE